MQTLSLEMTFPVPVPNENAYSWKLIDTERRTAGNMQVWIFCNNLRLQGKISLVWGVRSRPFCYNLDLRRVEIPARSITDRMWPKYLTCLTANLHFLPFIRNFASLHLLPPALRAAQACRYLIYSEADFEVFRPAGATRCTDGGEIWRGGGDFDPLLHFTPIGATTRV